MDEMKIKLSTKFMRGLVSKLLSTAIKSKTGIKMDIQINDLDIDFVDGDTKVAANVELKLANTEFIKITKLIGLE